MVDWLLNLIRPKPGLNPPSQTTDELEREAVRQELREVQARLRALSSEADVLSRNTGAAAEHNL